MRAETRRELETATTKREAEFARTQKQLQEQLEAALLSQEKEREELLGRISELQISVDTHREALSLAPAPAAAEERDASWESRAVEGLEADIENYRNRIKTLLHERDAWQVEKEKLSAKIAEVPVATELSAPSSELVGAYEKAQADLATATAERQRLTAQIHTLNSVWQRPNKPKRARRH
jgi:chromosome segregation ATPase